MKKYIKYSLISISSLIALIVIILGYYLFFGEMEIVEMSNYDPNKALPKNAPKVEEINEDLLYDYIDKTKYDYYIIRLWTTTTACDSDLDTTAVNSIIKNCPKVKYMIIAYDPFAKNMDKFIASYMYGNKYYYDSYILNYKFRIWDLNYKQHMLHFVNELLKNKKVTLENANSIYVLNRKKEVVYECDYIDSDIIENVIYKNKQ